MGQPDPPLIQLDGVSKTFAGGVRAVADVDLEIKEREILSVVGESGSGKTTLGRLAGALMRPTGGAVRFRGRAVTDLPKRAARAMRHGVQMVFQDPAAALNPRMTAGQIIAEAPLAHGFVGKRDRDSFITEQMRRVGLDPDTRHYFPHQFSGGQRQRIGIARALAVSPALLICDEPVAALDVSIQAQIINLFVDLRQSLDLTYLMISHDLGLVRLLSDRVAVMYLGRIVELAAADALFDRPHHPYSRTLIENMPTIDGPAGTFRPIEGEMPSPMAPPPGCAFHPRCRYAQPRCRQEQPRLRPVGPNHVSACHFDIPPDPPKGS